MPRVSREQTERNRIAIEEASVRLFKEQGLKGPSVADVMASVGLTHGGFYGHFESKDHLAGIAVARAFEGTKERWAARIDKHGHAGALKAIVQAYVSAAQRNDLETSCPAAALAGDVAREPLDKPVHAAYLAGVQQMVDTLTEIALHHDAAEGTTTPPLRSAARTKAARQQAMHQVATLVGALMIARATRGDPFSEEMLVAARKALLDPPPD